MSKRVNAVTIEARQARHGVAERLGRVLRALAASDRRPGRAELFLELSCRLGRADYSPSDSFGFVLINATRLARGKAVPCDVLCLCQIVKTAIMYLGLFDAAEDAQDLRSCTHYVDWLEEYAKSPGSYDVTGSVRHGWYLWNRSDPGEPHSPQWLQENEGETL